jgi:polysaccharide pyruvyl transferase WcaK-like protein
MRTDGPVRGRPRSDRPPLRVAFFGEIGSGNTGNDGSFEVALDWVRRTAPDAEAFAICRGPEHLTARYEIPAYPMFPAWKADTQFRGLRAMRKVGRKAREPLWLYRLLRGTDWVVVPGAGVLESTWHRPWMLPYSLYALTLAARARRTRVALINVGADRPSSRWSRRLIGCVARQADYLTVRDRHSVASLQSLGVAVSIAQVRPDLAFGLPIPSDKPPRPRSVGIGLINYFDWRGTPKERDANRRSYEQTMIELVGWLLEQNYSVRLFTGDIWDDPCLNRVSEALRAARPDLAPDRLVAEPARDLHELMEQMEQVEVVIGARYHNIITALRLAKPLLALSYAPKAVQAVERFGVSSFAHRIEAVDLPRLKGQFNDLYEQRSELRARLLGRLGEVESELEAQRKSFAAELVDNRQPVADRQS